MAKPAIDHAMFNHTHSIPTKLNIMYSTFYVQIKLVWRRLAQLPIGCIDPLSGIEARWSLRVIGHRSFRYKYKICGAAPDHKDFQAQDADGQQAP